MPVSVNGKVVGFGTPGAFASVNHLVWRNGDEVTLEPPAKPQLVQYTGMDQIEGKVGKRYALKLGAFVMPCVGLFRPRQYGGNTSPRVGRSEHLAG